jgi:hypothetical protein
MVLAILLLLISQGKEEVVLARLEDLELCMPLPGCLYGPVERHDPLNVAATIPKCKQLPPEQIMARSVILKKCFIRFGFRNLSAAFISREVYLRWFFKKCFCLITSSRGETFAIGRNESTLMNVPTFSALPPCLATFLYHVAKACLHFMGTFNGSDSNCQYRLRPLYVPETFCCLCNFFYTQKQSFQWYRF